MSTDNTGVQTRAMAQRTDSEHQETQNQNVNPTVELHKSKDRIDQGFCTKTWDNCTRLVCTKFLKHQSR